MATLTSCDYCGEIIDHREGQATLSVFLLGDSPAPSNYDRCRGQLNYHASRDRNCIGRIHDALDTACAMGMTA